MSENGERIHIELPSNTETLNIQNNNGHTIPEISPRDPDDETLFDDETNSNDNLQSGSSHNDTFGELTLRNHDQDKLCKAFWKYNTKTTRTQNYVDSKALMLDPQYRIDPNRYGGLLRGYVRQDWNTVQDNHQHGSWEELHPSWTELFFDLMFVAAIIHISGEVLIAYDSKNYIFILQSFLQFGLLQLAWFECVLYESRFRMNQKIDGVMRAVYMLFILAMGLAIQDDEISNKIFLISYGTSKLILLILFIKVYLIPRAKHHAIFMIIEKIISILIVIFILIFININPKENFRRLASYYIAVDVSQEHIQMSRIYTWIFGSMYLFSYIYMIIGVHINCIRHLGVNIPVNVPHVSDRLGEFLLIVLGETIIAIMVQHVNIKSSPHIQYIVTISSFLICYGCGKLYFECQPSEEDIHHGTKNHAMTTTLWKGRIYGYAHNVLYFGLLGLGIGMKITTHSLENYDKTKAIYVMLPGISCIIICVSVNIIRLTHPVQYNLLGNDYKKIVKIVWIIRVICILVMVIILCFYKKINHFIILGVYVISFMIQISIDVEGEIRNKQYKQKLKHQASKKNQENRTQYFRKSFQHIRVKKSKNGAVIDDFMSVAGTL